MVWYRHFLKPPMNKKQASTMYIPDLNFWLNFDFETVFLKQFWSLIFFLNFDYSIQFSNPFTNFGRVCKSVFFDIIALLKMTLKYYLIRKFHFFPRFCQFWYNSKLKLNENIAQHYFRVTFGAKIRHFNCKVTEHWTKCLHHDYCVTLNSPNVIMCELRNIILSNIPLLFCRYSINFDGGYK